MKRIIKIKHVLCFMMVLLCIPSTVMAYSYGGNANSGYNGNITNVPIGSSAWYPDTWGVRVTIVDKSGHRWGSTRTIDIVNSKGNITTAYHNPSVPYKYAYVTGTGPSFTPNLANVYTSGEIGINSVPNILNQQNPKLIETYFKNILSGNQRNNLLSKMNFDIEKFKDYVRNASSPQDKLYLIVEPLYRYSYFENGRFKYYFTTSTEMTYVIKNTYSNNAYLWGLLYTIAPFSIYLTENLNVYTRVNLAYSISNANLLRTTNGYGIGVFWINDLIPDVVPDPYYCTIKNGKYYDNSGKETTKDKYLAACGCRNVGDKYYDKNNNEVNYTAYVASCKPQCTVSNDNTQLESGKVCQQNIVVGNKDWACATENDELKDNIYCTISCRETTDIDLPTISSDKKLPGTYLEFGQIGINGTKECQIDIEVDRWYRDYQSANEAVKSAYSKYVSAYNQYAQYVGCQNNKTSDIRWTTCYSPKTEYDCSGATAAYTMNFGTGGFPFQKYTLDDGTTACQIPAIASSTSKWARDYGLFQSQYCDKHNYSDSKCASAQDWLRKYIRKARNNASNSYPLTAKTTYEPYSCPDGTFKYRWTNIDNVTITSDWVYGCPAAVSSSTVTNALNNYNVAVKKRDNIEALMKSCTTATVSYNANPDAAISYKDPSELYKYNGKMVYSKQSNTSETTNSTFDLNKSCSGSNCSKTNYSKASCSGSRCSDKSVTFKDGLGISSLYTHATNEFSLSVTYEINQNKWRHVLKPEGIYIDNDELKSKYSSYYSSNNYKSFDQTVLPIGLDSMTGKYADNLWITLNDIGGNNSKYKCYYEFEVARGDQTPSCPETDPCYPACNCNPDKLTCTYKNGKWYDKNGKVVSKKAYKNSCDPSSPGGGGSGQIVIYRPIDLTDPFPGYDARIRIPGYNWRSEWISDADLKGKYAKYLNSKTTYYDVEKYIHDNRGVTDYDVYSKDPMYSITLTPQIIKEIRAYNDNQRKNSSGYADFNMKCISGGNECKSEFIRNSEFTQYFSGCGIGNWNQCDKADGITR